MALTIKPFRAAHYNPAQVKDYSKVVCPPYDVISKLQLKTLRKKSPYNFSRVLIADNNDYQKAGRIFRRWIKDGILIEPGRESLYIYEQNFKVAGKPFKRFGILSLLKMDKSEIFPHEHTLKAPKADRKKIIRTVKANLSPIFVIAAANLRELHKIYKFYSSRKPFAAFKDAEGNLNRVWVVEDKLQIQRLAREIDKSELVIADGHHRFEISFDYFRKHKNKFKDLNYILAYITDCQKGLVILPTHRVLNTEEKNGEFFKKLSSHFNIEVVRESALEKRINREKNFCFGVYRRGKFYFLKPKDPRFLDMINDKDYRRLPTYALHQAVLPLLRTAGETEYTHSLQEARILAGRKKTAFILKAITLDSIFKISRRGLRFPQKSTYFYPKVLSGIVTRKFNA